MNAIGKFALVLSSVVWIAADVQSVHATNGVPDLSLPHPYGGYVHPHWNDDCSEFWYVAFGPDFSETYWWVNCQTGEKSPVFDIPKLQQAMIKAGFDETARMSNLSLEDIKRVDGKKLQLDLYGSRWIYDPAANSLQPTNVVPPLPRPLPALPGPEASSSYAIEETTVNFFNLKKRKITVSQIMHDMSKVGLTSPSNWKGVQSWCSNEGDVFEIDDESGKTMGIFRATGNPSQIDIDALFDNGGKLSASTAPASQRSSMQPKLVFRGNNLFVADEKSGSENQLTSDGRPGDGYPVIEKVYAGPQEQGVQKWFYEFSEEEALAKCGFIVVESAGMGTNFRSKAFHDVVWHNIAEAGFPDRMAWIKAAAAKYPQMDISRLGIYGTSSGAENAVRALESHNDFYHLAVGGFGIYDDRTFAGAEQWMGWPIGDWYKTQSDVEDASKLKGDLLLISGELDHTADPAFTMQMAGALVKTNKDFEFLELPNADHGEYGDYGLRRRAEFFMRHLLPQKSH